MRTAFFTLHPGWIRILPKHPLLRTLLLVVGGLALLALLAFGLVAAAVLVLFGTLAVLIRRFLPRRTTRGRAARVDANGVIEGDFTVIDPHPRDTLPHARIG